MVSARVHLALQLPFPACAGVLRHVLIIQAVMLSLVQEQHQPGAATPGHLVEAEKADALG